MEATFYEFKKRSNSTKRPSGGVTDTVLLKSDDCDVTSPKLEVVGTSFTDYNYVYIPFFNRYYWIIECTSIAYATYILSLECDVLASFADDIIGTDVFCSMSQYYYDSELDDNRVVATGLKSEISTEYGDFDIIQAPSAMYNPCYELMSVCTEGGHLNGVDILFGLNLAGSVLKKMADRNWVKQFAADVQGVNPFDAINACWMTPLIPQKCHEVASTSTKLYDISISGQCISSAQVISHSGTVDIPKPSVNDFRYSDKFVSYYLVLPYIGVVNVPVELAKASSKMSYSYCGDCLTGQITVVPQIGGVVLGVFGTSLKSDIQLSRQGGIGAQIATTSLLDAGMGAIGGAQIGGAYGAIIGAVGGGAIGSVQGIAAMPKISRTSTNNGSICPVGCRDKIGNLRLVMREGDSNVDPSEFADVCGRPTQRAITIGSGAGYIQTVNASVEIWGYNSEQNKVNALLDGGIYVE